MNFPRRSAIVRSIYIVYWKSASLRLTTVGEQDDRLLMVKFLATLVGSVPGATEITPVPICENPLLNHLRFGNVVSVPVRVMYSTSKEAVYLCA